MKEMKAKINDAKEKAMELKAKIKDDASQAKKKAAVLKAEKQTRINNLWQKDLIVSPLDVKRLDDARETHIDNLLAHVTNLSVLGLPIASEAEISHSSIILDVMDSMVDRLSEMSIEEMRLKKFKLVSRGIPMVNRQAELSWYHRAIIIFFVLHPELGNGSFDLAAGIFARQARTIEGWIQKRSFWPKWTGFVKGMNAGQVLDSVARTNDKEVFEVDRNSIVNVERFCEATTPMKQLIITHDGKLSAKK